MSIKLFEDREDDAEVDEDGGGVMKGMILCHSIHL